MTLSRPNFRDPAFLLDHARSIFAFYEPRCIDESGGFFHYFKDDGTVYDRSTRHLVSSARVIFNYARAATAFGRPELLAGVRHGLAYLRAAHLNPQTGGYTWLIEDGRRSDNTNHCYGLAFVLLAYATALQ
ncbi:MAG: AGE family epimerase/isomerase, partial [Alphaproteobacteria bacterium]|nr:AGE family epimerase/isomerase [Alphaproteobacteria bacterium]